MPELEAEDSFRLMPVKQKTEESPYVNNRDKNSGGIRVPLLPKPYLELKSESPERTMRF